MGLIDFFRRKKTFLENEKGEIHSETMENSNHKIEEWIFPEKVDTANSKFLIS